MLRPSDKHHPVVGEAFHGGFLPDLGSVSQLQLHLDGTLRGKRRGAAGERPNERRWGWRPGGTGPIASSTGAHGHSRTINTQKGFGGGRVGKTGKAPWQQQKTGPTGEGVGGSRCHRESAGRRPRARCQGRSVLPSAPPHPLPALRRQDHGSKCVRAPRRRREQREAGKAACEEKFPVTPALSQRRRAARGGGPEETRATHSPSRPCLGRRYRRGARCRPPPPPRSPNS